MKRHSTYAQWNTTQLSDNIKSYSFNNRDGTAWHHSNWNKFFGVSEGKYWGHTLLSPDFNTGLCSQESLLTVLGYKIGGQWLNVVDCVQRKSLTFFMYHMFGSFILILKYNPIGFISTPAYFQKRMFSLFSIWRSKVFLSCPLKI